MNVGAFAETILARISPRVSALLPKGASTLAALHDIGKITLGFQIKFAHWILREDLSRFGGDEKSLSVGEHALVSPFSPPAWGWSA